LTPSVVGYWHNVKLLLPFAPLGFAERSTPTKGVKHLLGQALDAGSKESKTFRWGSQFLVDAGATPSLLRLSRWTRTNSGALALPEQSRIILAGARLILSILGNGLCRPPLVGELRKSSLAGRHMKNLCQRC